jgi:hypothetical protein
VPAYFVGANFVADPLGAKYPRGVLFGSNIWSTTICPDGTDSDNDAGTCANNGLGGSVTSSEDGP